MKTFIIAEAGSNHDGKFEQALKLIDVAKEAGCDAVKFQLFKSEDMYSKNTPDFAGYKNIPELIKSLELPRTWVGSLKDYCDSIGIEFMASPFDESAVDLLLRCGVKHLKIAGFESTDLRFLKYIRNKTNIPLIVSIGANVSDYLLKQIVGIVCGIDFNTEKQTVYSENTFLHVVQSYPCPIEQTSLLELQTLYQAVKPYANVGYSDHTEGILIPSVAVVQGAEVIEKHFTLDRTLSGPDHKFAIEPNELKEMVKNIRLIESALTFRGGDMGSSLAGWKEKRLRINKCEKEFVKAKRAVYAKGDIKKGSYLTEDSITTKRPCMNGDIPAEQFYNILGMVADKDIIDDTPIKSQDIISSQVKWR